MNFKEIVTAWIDSYTANEDKKKIAAERLLICNGCSSRKEIIKDKKWADICGECGCPLSKKIFSRRYNPCPLEKWGEVDKKYFNLKENKTII